MPEVTNILLVEDNVGDILLIREMLYDAGVPFHLDVVNNGEDALRFLRENASVKPQLIILDLNMPRVSGREFLEGANGLLDGIHILILSGSPGVREVATALPYRRMVKPETNEDFDSMVITFREILGNLSSSSS